MVSSSELLAPLRELNAGKAWPGQVKPFHFLLVGHIRPFGHLVGVDPSRFQPVAPYEANASTWKTLPWIDRYSGKRYRMGSTDARDDHEVMQLQTYRDVVREFRTHPEAKSVGPDGRPWRRQTVGLLGRRVVHSIPELTTHVGKESNRLEAVEAGLEHDPDEVWTEYQDPGRDPWKTLVLPVLRQMPIERLVVATGMHRRSLFAIRAGERRPHPQNRRALTAAAGAFAREALWERGATPQSDDLAACATLAGDRVE